MALEKASLYIFCRGKTTYCDFFLNFWEHIIAVHNMGNILKDPIPALIACEFRFLSNYYPSVTSKEPVTILFLLSPPKD